jgi:hypothetical protein
MNLIKSKRRVADHGEVFTPQWLVEKMLDLVKGETERIDSRILEPACGSGNFLVPVLQRKLAAVEVKFGKTEFERRHYSLLAVMCTYGIELLADNIAECRENMLEVFADYLNLDETDELYRAASYVLSQVAALTSGSPFEKADPKSLKMTGGRVHKEGDTAESGTAFPDILKLRKLSGLDGQVKTEAAPEAKQFSMHSFGAFLRGSLRSRNCALAHFSLAHRN